MVRLGFDVIILGAPAAGKDTQADLLKKDYKFRPVESGKHWRRMAKQKNAQGDLLRKTFSKGNPAPVKLMKEFIVKQMKAVPKSADLLFIGNPRLKPEAQLLTKLLAAKHRDYFVIAIDLPPTEVTKRSRARMRDEQDWKYVPNRIRMYRLQVMKTIQYFKKAGKLKIIDGNRSISTVHKDIIKALHDHQRQQANRRITSKR